MSDAPGMPSEETIAELLRTFGEFGTTASRERQQSRECARAILSLIRPAFEAKDAEIETLKKLPVIADYIEVQDAHRAAEAKLADKEREIQKVIREVVKWSTAAGEAEASLAQAVEALRPFADEENGVMQDLLWGDEPDSAIATITTRLGHIRAARAVVRRARSASNIGQNEGEKT